MTWPAFQVKGPLCLPSGKMDWKDPGLESGKIRKAAGEVGVREPRWFEVDTMIAEKMKLGDGCEVRQQGRATAETPAR